MFLLFTLTVGKDKLSFFASGDKGGMGGIVEHGGGEVGWDGST